MPFAKTSFRMTGDGCFVFPMVVFELRTTLMAINLRIPYMGAVWGRSDESLLRNGTLAEFCGDGAVRRPALPRCSGPFSPRTALGPPSQRPSKPA